MDVAEKAAQGEWRRKAGRNWDKGFSVVSCPARSLVYCEKYIFFQQPQNWIALGYLQEKQSCNNFLSFNNM